MVIKLNVSLQARSYPIYISTDYSAIGKCISNSGIGQNIVLVTDKNVEEHQSEKFLSCLIESGYNVSKLVIEAGEKVKNLDTVSKIYSYLVNLKLDRNSTVMALGGGVVGDITGFVAATFLRGINFIQVPTSLLAQVDSSIGGKVGVDFLGSKNIIGAFYQPKFVYINVNSLQTLPKKELISGMAEVIKHAVIADKEYFEFIDYNMNKILSLDSDVMQYIVKTSCLIKGNVVEKDEKESGLRAILNFGHTIGHSVESVSNFQLLHGECVSIGMAAAVRLANRMNMIDHKEAEEVEGILKKTGLPITISGFNAEDIYKQMFYDKKIKGNRLIFVLPKKIGEVVQCFIDDETLIKQAINEIINN